MMNLANVKFDDPEIAAAFFQMLLALDITKAIAVDPIEEFSRLINKKLEMTGGD